MTHQECRSVPTQVKMVFLQRIWVWNWFWQWHYQLQKYIWNYGITVLTKNESISNICHIRTKSLQVWPRLKPGVPVGSKASLWTGATGNAMSPGDPSAFARSFRLQARFICPLFCSPQNLSQSCSWELSLNVAKKFPIYVAIIRSPYSCYRNPQKETEECKPLLQQKCHQVRNMLVGVWPNRFNGTNVQILAKYTNAHQMANAHQMCKNKLNMQMRTKCVRFPERAAQ